MVIPLNRVYCKHSIYHKTSYNESGGESKSKRYLYRGQYLREALTLRFEGYCPRFYWQFYTIETLL